PSTPSCVVFTPKLRARANPSESGSIPTTVSIATFAPCSKILIIRSVPILPEPIIAARTFSTIHHSFNLCFCCFLLRNGRKIARLPSLFLINCVHVPTDESLLGPVAWCRVFPLDHGGALRFSAD